MQLLRLLSSASNWDRPLFLWLLTVGGLIAVFFGLRFFWNLESRQVENELQTIAQSGRPSADWAAYDLICFNSNAGTEMRDFARAAHKVGHDIVEQCGVQGSCCELESNNPGVIVLVRAKKIKCIQIRFAYLLEGQREACIKPSQLNVSQQIFREKTHTSGRPWVGRSGDAYYLVRERQQ